MFSIILLQIEDRKDDKLTRFMKENKKICQKNGIQYIFIEKSRDHVPPYWGKIFELRRIMEENTDVDYFIWLDSDAFFIHFNNNKLYELLKTHEKYSMIITKDMPPWGNAEFNAGSFIIKNDEYGNKIINKWCSLYNSNDWTYKDDKWVTESTWAGNSYEQGSFVTYILNESEYKSHIVQLPYDVLNNNNCESVENTISTHLAGNFKNDESIVDKCLSIFQSAMENFDVSNESLLINYIVVGVLLFFLFKHSK